MATALRLGHSRHAGASTYLPIAQEAGFYDDHGIALDVVELHNTNAAIASVIGGATDVASGPGLPVLKAALAGADPLIVLSNAAINVYAVMGAPGVSTPDDLRGAPIGLTEPYGQDTLVLRRALLDWGLDPDRDVRLRFMHKRRAIWEALLDGTIAAMGATVPEPAAARNLGLAILRDFAPERRPYQLGCLVTTRRFADARPDVLRAFLAATVAGVRLFRSDADLAVRHLRSRLEVEDTGVLYETHRVFCSPDNDFVPTPKGLAEVARDYADLMNQRIDLDVTGYVDASFLPTASGPDLGRKA